MISGLGRLRPEDEELKASLSYIARPCLKEPMGFNACLPCMKLWVLPPAVHKPPGRGGNT